MTLETILIGTILIGWAGVNVTPDKAVTLAGQFNIRVSERVHDPVTATALALDNGSAQAIIVSLDAVKVSDYVRDRCRNRLGVLLPEFNPENLFISATHTHTAPTQAVSKYPVLNDPAVMTPEEYSDMLVEKLACVCAEAWKGRKPGAVSWGRGQAVVGFNRRLTYFDNSSRMYGKADDPQFSHAEGYEDHGVDMLFTYDDRLNLTGMIVNLACPSQRTEGENFVSADFWHETRNEIRKRHGRNLFILPQCSAAGDQSPHLLLHKAAETRMRQLKGLADGSIPGLGQRQEIALRIAAAVDEVLPLAARDIRRKLLFIHKVSTIDLPVRKISLEEAEYCRQQLKSHEDALAKCEKNPRASDYSTHYRKVRYYMDALARFAEQRERPVLPVESHVIRLGDIAFATNRFELYLDFGLRIKARSRAVQTFVVQLAGEGSYLPTARAITAGSYGAGAPDNLVGPEGGQTLVEEQLKAINAMFAE